MDNIKIEDLKEDLADLQNLLNVAKRQRNKNLLNTEIRKLETQLTDVQAAALFVSATPLLDVSNKGTESKPVDDGNRLASPINKLPIKRYEVELTNYAWDQSEKFVKIFVTLDGVQNLNADEVFSEFTEKNLCLRVNGLNNKNYKMIINNLLDVIDVERSYHKIKTNLIVIYLKKTHEGKTWSHLTLVGKRIQDNKPDKFAMGNNDATDPKDPTAGLFNMMKNLYQSGDSEMKRMISKAWVEGEEKRRSNQTDDMNF